MGVPTAVKTNGLVVNLHRGKEERKLTKILNDLEVTLHHGKEEPASKTDQAAEPWRAKKKRIQRVLRVNPQQVREMGLLGGATG